MLLDAFYLIDCVYFYENTCAIWFRLIDCKKIKCSGVGSEQCGFNPNLPALKWLNRRQRMQTLSISQVFSQFSFYQDSYLQILNDPSKYYVEVEDAYVHVWPFAKQKLYLGDLLQLWFSAKWKVSCQAESLLDVLEEKSQTQTHSYLYQVTGHFFSSNHQTLAWSEQQSVTQPCEIEHALPYYLIFKALSRPENSLQTLNWAKP